MAKRLNVAPTKSVLLALRHQESFLTQGHTLLERKKELLTRLVYQRLHHYRKLRGEARVALRDAYTWLGITTMRMNRRTLRQINLALKPAIRVEIVARRSLGVEYPSVNAEQLPLQPVGLMGTDPSLDETRIRMARAAVVLARLGEAETALWRLLEEQRKTQKRVNALKYNIIPRYRETIRYIQSSLEEEERDTLFQVKRLRERSHSP